MQPKTFRNILPKDTFQAVKSGEYFTVIEKSTYYCARCECKPLQPCETFKEMSFIDRLLLQKSREHDCL